MDVADKLKQHQLSSENMADIYDVSLGKPVLHNTALRFTVNYCDTDVDTSADYQVPTRSAQRTPTENKQHDTNHRQF